MDLVEALAADGLVCVVGAGGKKSTLYALAPRIDRAVVTATVRIPIFDPHVARVVVTGDPIAAAERADRWPLGVVPAREREDRYLGYDPDTVAGLAAANVADAVLVKADGARTREFKAPSDREPQVPASADTVLPVASVRAVGKPLADDRVHRVDRVSEITGLRPGEIIRPTDVAAVLTSERGGLKDAPAGATVVPVLNKVDTDDLADVAREIAEPVANHPRIDRVALTRFASDDPLVEVVASAD
ncbi:selenium cofactor biosynthesis protein YqeC [Halegenticoccus tardaugens]|uniref:selenium cofactor biosynthesis protein YqeC n=1 Tax=Halegenticoccus tardaugens TaxID=2071624 RepID=UPI00100BAB91|nr:selenium cofactor biosynthesis protein YqeC [Halegenticoccus tardaugens]